jgi:hypothetical protein
VSLHQLPQYTLIDAASGRVVDRGTLVWDLWQRVRDFCVAQYDCGEDDVELTEGDNGHERVYVRGQLVAELRI